LKCILDICSEAASRCRYTPTIFAFFSVDRRVVCRLVRRDQRLVDLRVRVSEMNPSPRSTVYRYSPSQIAAGTLSTANTRACPSSQHVQVLHEGLWPALATALRSFFSV